MGLNVQRTAPADPGLAPVEPNGPVEASDGTRSDIAPTALTYNFFPVTISKFVVMSVCSFGTYQFYWSYKNWQRVRDGSDESLSAFGRAFSLRSGTLASTGV